MATVFPTRAQWPAQAKDGGGSSTVAPAPLSKEELVRLEFFRSYDVMTGVRIAATLGGFFGLMVLLVLYKSRCRTKKTVIKEVRLAAAKAVVEEEEQQEAVAAAIYMQTVVTGRCPRRSVGAMSAPLAPGAGPGSSLPPLPCGLAGQGPAPAAAFLDADHLTPGRPRPLPPRFSSLGGCSLLEAKQVALTVRRASMLPTEQNRHLHHRLHQHQQHHQHHRRDHYSHHLQLQQLGGPPFPPCAAPDPGALGVIDSSPEQAASGANSPEAAGGAAAGSLAMGPPAGPGAAAVRARTASPLGRAPLARISTIESSLKEDELDARDSYGSDSVFAVLPDRDGDRADTDQDADDQLSTDSDTTTPHQVNQVVVSIETNRAMVHKLFVLPAKTPDGTSPPNLQEELDQAMQSSGQVVRQKKTMKVLASLESAASDEYSITPDQSQDASQCQSHDLR